MVTVVKIMTVALGAVLLPLCPIPAHAQDKPACSSLLSFGDRVAPDKRPIVADDLVRLRDIGPRWRPALENFIGVSPDEKTLAFFLTRADPATNAICRALISIDVAKGSRPHILNLGGDPIYELLDIRGLLTDYGYPAADRPLWSPDGKWIAFLRRDAGSTQIWRASRDGSEEAQVSKAGEDVETFAWSRDGHSLLYGTRPGLSAAKQALRREGLGGYLYDWRSVPYNDSKPGIALPVPFSFFAVDPSTGVARAATAEERALVQPAARADSAAYPLKLSTNATGRHVWTALDNPSRWMTPISLRVDGKNREGLSCPDPLCRSTELDPIIGLWWSESGKQVLFLRRIADDHSLTALFRWVPGARTAKRIFATEDLLGSCNLVREDLICAREGSLQPRRLVAIDTRSGRRRMLFDPNPDFIGVRLGTVERLHWRNSYGLASFGDLVLPPDYDGKSRLPMIVVQYDTRGFLRGGTGDEYPIQLFAAHGYAVLSVQKPAPYYSSLANQPWATWQDAEIENIRNFNERRSNLSSLMAGVKSVTDRGIIDPARIGITGLSDGSTTVQFALIHTHDFAAASISSAGTDSQSMIYGGPALAEDRKHDGYPAPGIDGSAFWAESSLAFKTDGPRIPVLMQLADHEYLLGLEEYTILKERIWPVELYSFPGEYHLKTQPSHRIAIYNRNLAWFDFWLRGIRDKGLVNPEAYDRWAKIREATAPSSVSRSPHQGSS